MSIKTFWDKKTIEWDEKTIEEQMFICAVFTAILLVLIIFLHGIGDLPWNILLLDASESFFVYFIGLGIVFLYKLIRKRLIRKKIFYIIWLLFLVLSLPHIPVLCGYATTQIGDFYEAKEYTEKYIVIMSREPQGTKKRKLYTLPAEIERRFDYESTDDHGNDYYTLRYHINYLYFPDGGYLSFDYDFAYEAPSCSTLQIDKEMEVTDKYGDLYYVTLTKKRAK